MVFFYGEFDFVVDVGGLIAWVFLLLHEFFVFFDGAGFGRECGGDGFGGVDEESVGMLVVDPFGDVFLGGIGCEEDDGGGCGEGGVGVVDLEDEDGFLIGDGVEESGGGEAGHGVADQFFFCGFDAQCAFVDGGDVIGSFWGVLGGGDGGCDAQCGG